MTINNSEATGEEQQMMARAQRYQSELDAYAREQATRPQTIGYSPAGLAAWIYTLFQDVSDNDGDPEKIIDRDEILDDIMLYWLPNAAASAARLYWEDRRSNAVNAGRWEANPVPAGFSIFPGEAEAAIGSR